MVALPLLVFDVSETLLDLETMTPTFKRALRKFNSTSFTRSLSKPSLLADRTSFFDLMSAIDTKRTSASARCHLRFGGKSRLTRHIAMCSRTTGIILTGVAMGCLV